MALTDKYISVSQAAKELGVTRQTIHRWVAKKYVPVEKVGRVVLIKKKDLHEYERWRLSEAAADSIIALFFAVANQYAMNKGLIKEGERVEFMKPADVSPDEADKVHILSAEERAEIMSRFKPVLEGFLKDFPQNIGIVGGRLPKDKQKAIRQRRISK